eukprot:Skav216408  [mRNA]  locus=scaffold457:469327:473979:+ [translate_table: standard]
MAFSRLTRIDDTISARWESDECFGQLGTGWFKERTNLMIDAKSTTSSDGVDILSGDIWIPQGATIAQIKEGHVPVSNDRPMGSSTTVENKCASVKKIPHGKVLLCNVIERFPKATHETEWVFDDQSTIHPRNVSRHDGVRMLEMFCGGHGGWTYAAEFLNHEYDTSIQTIGIDCSLSAIVCFAATHQATVLNGNESIPSDAFQSGCNFAIWGDIASKHWVEPVSCWEPDVMTMSSPCQSWSFSGSQSGLMAESGQLFVEGILHAKKVRVKVLLLENVPGFKSHPDSQLVLMMLRAAGFAIHWEGILDSSRYGGASRPRWLCMAVRMTDSADPIPRFIPWPQGRSRSPCEVGSILAWSPEITDALSVTEPVLQIASQRRFVAPSTRHKFAADGNKVLQSRCHDGSVTLPVCMAMYGSQHTIDQAKLQQKGYHGFFFKTGQSMQPIIRHFHPVEIALTHVVFHKMFTVTDLPTSWRLQGNQISVPHALIMLAHGINALLDESMRIPVESCVERLWHRRLTNQNVELWAFDYGYYASEHGTEHFPPQVKEAIQALCKVLQRGTLPTDSAWHPSKGFVKLQDLAASCEPTDVQAAPMSQVSVPSQSEAGDMTQPFATMHQVQIKLPNDMFSLWTADDVNPTDLTRLWNCNMVVQELAHETPSEYRFVLETTEFEPPAHPFGSLPVAYVQDGILSLYAWKDGTPFVEQVKKWGLPEDIHDQYGQIGKYQQYVPGILLTPTPWNQSRTNTPLQPSVVLAAMQGQVMFSCQWDPIAFCLTIVGDAPQVESNTLKQFWQEIIPEDVQRQMELQPVAELTEWGYRVQFVSTTKKCPVPPSALRHMLGCFATRFMLRHLTLPAPGGTSCVFKLKGRPLWEGHLVFDVTPEQLEGILNHSLKPILGEMTVRLLHKGKMWYLTPVGEIQHADHADAVIIHVGHSLRGGGNKDMLQVQTKNSIAATLLENGFDIAWVSSTTDTLAEKAGHKRLGPIAQLPGGAGRFHQIMQLCRECNIQIPKDAVTTATKRVNMATQHKQRRLSPQVPKPELYTIEEGYLKNQDGTDTKQISQVAAVSTGVVMVSAEQAIPWLRENQTISHDELAIFVIGQTEISTALHHQAINLPCKDPLDRKVIIAGSLVQLGERRVVVSTSTAKDVPVQDCQVVALTAWRSDWSEPEWISILKNTTQRFKEIMGLDGSDSPIVAVWGRSLRANGKPCNEELAESVQIHCTIQTDKVMTVLASTGFSRIFANPKNSAGRPSDQWRVIWLPGGDVASATSTATRTVGCAGLIRGKSGLGLRFPVDKFEAAWKVVKPSEDVPTHTGGPLTYRLQPLPYGCAATTIQTWAAHNSWEVKPIKAVGAQAWIVACKSPPPDGLLCFNGQPLLATMLPARNQQPARALIAGPRIPKHVVDKVVNSSPVDASDPWARYTPTTPSPFQSRAPISAQRQVEGPIAAQFKTQEQRIEVLEKSMQQLSQQTQSLAENQSSGFAAMETRDAETRTMVATSLANVKSEIEGAVTKALTAQATKLDTNLNELKDLFRQQMQVKRKGEEEEQQNMVL